MFGDDHRIAYIQVMLDKHFNFLNHLIWYKRNNQSIKAASSARRFACVSERILFYGLQDSTGHLSKSDGSTYCLDAANNAAVELYGKIRRLTPNEVERLQGFPVDWTAGIADTNRYKCLGNAVSVPVVEAIAERILKMLDEQ